MIEDVYFSRETDYLYYYMTTWYWKSVTVAICNYLNELEIKNKKFDIKKTYNSVSMDVFKKQDQLFKIFFLQ